MPAEPRQQLLEEQLTRSIIGAFYAVYKAMGFGFVEHVYAAALQKELVVRGHRVSREVNVPVFYRGEIVAYQRLDILVDDKVIVEIKAAERMPKAAEKQLYNYVRCTNLEIGLLFIFGVEADFRRLVHVSAQKSRACSA